MKRVSKILNDCKAATAIEYCLLAALIALAIIGALTQLGDQSTGIFGSMETKVRNVMP
jgi:pilus assembly protein Flp/PilA